MIGQNRDSRKQVSGALKVPRKISTLSTAALTICDIWATRIRPGAAPIQATKPQCRPALKGHPGET
jgi:hypothetical protein